MTYNDNDKFERKSSLKISNLGEEIALLDRESGIYYGLDQIGALIWDCLDDSTVVEMLDRITTQFEVQRETARTDLHAFLVQIEEQGLVSRSAANSPE